MHYTLQKDKLLFFCFCVLFFAKQTIVRAFVLMEWFEKKERKNKNTVISLFFVCLFF